MRVLFLRRFKQHFACWCFHGDVTDVCVSWLVKGKSRSVALLSSSSRTCLAGKGFRLSLGKQSSQERRAAVVPPINRLSIACEPLVERVFGSSTAYSRISLVRASGETFRTCPCNALEGTSDACLLGELFCHQVGVPSCQAPPRRPLCAAPTRPNRCMSGFWVRQVSIKL